jgi:uncharacterized protein YjbI with pentapeptide repeats
VQAEVEWFFREESSPLSEQDGRQATTIQRPTNDDREAWRAYWKAQGQSWRTEQEIDEGRKKYLAERRNITPDCKQGIFSFKDIEPRLSRSDIEWLLATHENGRGPVDWNDESQRSREGLDVRGADLHNLDLSGLPLTGMRGSLNADEWRSSTTISASIMAEVNLEGAFLNDVHLERANLRRAHMQRTELYEAHLEGADLLLAQLSESFLYKTHLEVSNLKRANLETANLSRAHLEGCNLCLASFNSRTILENIKLGNEKFGFATLSDVDWNGVNLAVVNWSQIKMIGDEQVARQSKTLERKKKDKARRLEEYEAAVRANRQLAIVLRNQGLNEEADHFAYRAQLLQRKVLWRQHEFGRWLFSMLLALLSGYGYRIWRILAAYIVMVSLFALTYFVLGMHYAPHLPLDQAFLESITAFHGRVFLEQFSSNTPQIWLTALEAIVGLIIEGVFIAMLIQRFFSK